MKWYLVHFLSCIRISKFRRIQTVFEKISHRFSCSLFSVTTCSISSIKVSIKVPNMNRGFPMGHHYSIFSLLQMLDSQKFQNCYQLHCIAIFKLIFLRKYGFHSLKRNLYQHFQILKGRPKLNTFFDLWIKVTEVQFSENGQDHWFISVIKLLVLHNHRFFIFHQVPIKNPTFSTTNI